jgi:hypothetical protein
MPEHCLTLRALNSPAWVLLSRASQGNTQQMQVFWRINA